MFGVFKVFCFRVFVQTHTHIQWTTLAKSSLIIIFCPNLAKPFSILTKQNVTLASFFVWRLRCVYTSLWNMWQIVLPPKIIWNFWYVCCCFFSDFLHLQCQHWERDTKRKERQNWLWQISGEQKPKKSAASNITCSLWAADNIIETRFSACFLFCLSSKFNSSNASTQCIRVRTPNAHISSIHCNLFYRHDWCAKWSIFISLSPFFPFVCSFVFFRSLFRGENYFATSGQQHFLLAC